MSLRGMQPFVSSWLDDDDINPISSNDINPISSNDRNSKDIIPSWIDNGQWAKGMTQAFMYLLMQYYINTQTSFK